MSAGAEESGPSLISVDVGFCRVEVPLRKRAVVEELDDVCTTSVREIFSTLGQRIEGNKTPISVRIVPSPADIADVAPKGTRPPPWSEAVAFPAHNLIVLSLRNHLGSPIPHLAEVLEHELSHFALRQALQDKPVPRWFSEGIAIHQSERSAFDRHWLVFLAARRNGLLQLNEIDQYPEAVGDVNLSYAQAADFLAWMLNENGWFGIRSVLRRVAIGHPFDKSVEAVYGQSLRSMEMEWRSKLLNRWQWVTLLTSTGALWGGITLLFLTAYVAAKRRKKRKLARMKLEEDAVDRVITAIDSLTEQKLPSSPKATSLMRMPTKIRVDDDIHTLH